MKHAASRLTPLGVIVLALLREADMHPYEMMRLLRQRRADRLVPLAQGTLYHTVARLERAGLIEHLGVDRAGNRPERTTYAVTDAGSAAVVEWVRAELPRLDRPVEIRVAIAEAHNLDRAEATSLLRQRLQALAAEREAYAESRARVVAREVPEQFVLELGRRETLLQAEEQWLGTLVARLASGDIGWGAIDPETRTRLNATREATLV